MSPTLLALAILAPTAPRETEAGLRWRFGQGQVHRFLVEQSNRSVAKVQGQEVATRATQALELAWTVESVGEDGTARIEQRIERFALRLESPFGVVAYDSNSTPAPNSPAARLADSVSAILEAPITLTVDPRGAIRAAEVPEATAARLASQTPAARALQMLATTEGIRDLLGMALPDLPEDGAVPPGESWERAVSAPAAGGTMSLVRTYTLDDRGDDGAAAISVTMALGAIQLPDGLDVEVVEQRGSGSYTFDAEAGRLLASEVSQTLTLDIAVEGSTATSEATSTTTLRRLDD